MGEEKPANPYGANPYELNNSPGRKARSLAAVYIGIASTIMISVTGSLMLPIAAAELGGTESWTMGLSLGSVASITLMPLYGYLTARNPHIKRPLFVVSFCISALVIFLRGVAPNIWVIIVPTLFMIITSFISILDFVFALPLKRLPEFEGAKFREKKENKAN